MRVGERVRTETREEEFPELLGSMTGQEIEWRDVFDE